MATWSKILRTSAGALARKYAKMALDAERWSYETSRDSALTSPSVRTLVPYTEVPLSSVYSVRKDLNSLKIDR